jgi:hypothetical protein
MNDQLRDSLNRRKEQNLNRRKIMVTEHEKSSYQDGYIMGHTAFTPDNEERIRSVGGGRLGRADGPVMKAYGPELRLGKTKSMPGFGESLQSLIEMREQMDEEIKLEAERILTTAVEQIQKVMPILNYTPEMIGLLFQPTQPSKAEVQAAKEVLERREKINNENCSR